jgi:uncharacterized membrane protein YdjX (TVP38/TMEM64 family)
MSRESHNRIHKKLKKHSPEGVKKAKKIFSFRYPKLFTLIVLILLAYYIFSQPFISRFVTFFNRLGQFGIFTAGALTSFGFTTPFGIGLLIKMTHSNIFLGALIGGLGATIADLLIFKTIKLSFMDEFQKLEKTKAIKEIGHIVKKNKSILIRHYLLYIFAGIILATPVPDEIGISMLAGLTTIKPLKFILISLVLHTIMVFFLLYFL